MCLTSIGFIPVFYACMVPVIGFKEQDFTLDKAERYLLINTSE